MTGPGGPIGGPDDGTGAIYPPGMNPDDVAVPFLVTDAHGGPLDTIAFGAGYHLGRIDTSLELSRPAGAAHVVFPLVPAVLLEQLDLIGMYRGYPIITHEIIDGAPDWCTVTFTRGDDIE